jgi:hypothetical protein
MKNDLTCAVVEDLLPSYAEGLTSPETNGAVERHLAGCKGCSAKLAAMLSPEPEQEREETAKEVDYLKKVKRRGWKRVTLAVLLTVLVLLGALAAKVFVIGSPASVDTMAVRTWTAGGQLWVDVTSNVSANAYWGWDTEVENGTARITAREVVVSPIHPTAWGRIGVPLEGVEEVYLCGRLIWQEGLITVALQKFETLYEAQTPYVGDPSALNRIAQALYLESLLGNYTFSLQTAAEPYGWTLEFGREMVGGQTDIMMSYLAPQMLAVVGNLGTVSWTYQDADGNTQTRTITLEEVDARLPELAAAYNAANGTDWLVLESVKDYAQSPIALQRLDAICWQLYADNTWPDAAS